MIGNIMIFSMKKNYKHNIFIMIAFIIFFLPFSVWGNQNKGVIRIPLQASTIFFDPSGVQDSQSLFVSRQINCQLARNQGYFSELEAAESVKYISPKEILFKISNEARFNDGTQVTANDVLASFNYIKKSRHVFQNIFSWIQEIKISDDKTVVFILKKESPQFLKVLSSTNYPIFKKEFLEKAQKDHNLWKTPIGCGGYKVSEFTNNTIKLTPIKGGLPIIFDLTKMNQINADEIENYDIVSINVIGNSKKLSDFDIVNIHDPVQFFIGLNSKSKFWKNKYDRCKFLDKLQVGRLLDAYGSPATGANDLLPKGTLGYNSSGSFKKIIHALSSKATNNDFLPHPETFCLAYLKVSVQEKYKNDYLDMLKEIYPNVIMNQIKSTKKFGKDFLDSKCDAFLFAWKASYYDGYEYLTMFEDNKINFSGVYNQNLSGKITNSQAIASANKRSQAYQNIINEVANSCIITSLFTVPVKKIYVRKNLKTPGIGLVPTHLYYLGNVTI